MERNVRIYSYGDEGEKLPHGHVELDPHLVAGSSYIDVAASVKAGGKISLVIIRVRRLAVSKKSKDRKVVSIP